MISALFLISEIAYDPTVRLEKHYTFSKSVLPADSDVTNSGSGALFCGLEG